MFSEVKKQNKENPKISTLEYNFSGLILQRWIQICYQILIWFALPVQKL